MKYQLAIFDFDGTLADSFPWFLRMVNLLAAEFHFQPVLPADYERLRQMDTRQILAHLQVPVWKLPAIAARFRAWSERDAASLPLFPGIDTALKQLHSAGVQLAVLSSNSPHTIRSVLGPDLTPLFHRIEGGSSLLGKARRLQKLLASLGTPPGHAIYIGDEVRDATAAARAGLDFGAVAWGYTHVDALRTHKPAVVLLQPSHLANLTVPQASPDL